MYSLLMLEALLLRHARGESTFSVHTCLAN